MLHKKLSGTPPSRILKSLAGILLEAMRTFEMGIRCLTRNATVLLGVQLHGHKRVSKFGHSNGLL